MVQTPSLSPLAEPFDPYPDSASDTPYTTTADAGEFFSTLLDIINPLQHIPLVSNLYREVTGDEIEPAARLVGGALFGGPIGFASASANVLLEQASGDDLLGHAVALFSDDGAPVPLNSATDPGGDPGADPKLVADATENAGSASLTAAAIAESDAIIWAGPRVIPSFARAGNIEPVQQVAMNSTTSEASPETTTPSDDKAWLTEARSAAETNRAARENGQIVPLASPQPWVATAMLEALDKYDALARARSDDTTDRNAAAPDDDS